MNNYKNIIGLLLLQIYYRFLKLTVNTKKKEKIVSQRKEFKNEIINNKY